jgi:hypothetical protein
MVWIAEVRPPVWVPVLAGVLALVGTVLDGSAGLVQQQLFAPDVSPAARASFVRAQDDVDRRLGRRPHGVHVVAHLPAGAATGAPGDLFVAGNCAGLWVRDPLGALLPVERAPAAGVVALTLPPGFAGVAVRFVGAATVSVDRRGHVAVRAGGRTYPGGPVGGTRLAVSVDRLNGTDYLSVRSGAGATLTTAPVAAEPPFSVAFGREIRAAPADVALCRRLLTRR